MHFRRLIVDFSIITVHTELDRQISVCWWEKHGLSCDIKISTSLRSVSVMKKWSQYAPLIYKPYCWILLCHLYNNVKCKACHVVNVNQTWHSMWHIWHQHLFYGLCFFSFPTLPFFLFLHNQASNNHYKFTGIEHRIMRMRQGILLRFLPGSCTAIVWCYSSLEQLDWLDVRSCGSCALAPKSTGCSIKIKV